MKLKKVDKKKYVESLRDLLKLTNPCTCCPQGAYLRSKNYVDDSCKACRSFISTRPRKVNMMLEDCPCHILGKEEALKRAALAIEQWDKGTHKWQRKGAK